MSEERYDCINLIIKQCENGESWFDVLFEYIAGDCEGGGGECILAEGEDSDCDDHEHNELLPCTCGLESMGGSSGTLEECYNYQTTIGQNLQPIDLAYIIRFLNNPDTSPPSNIEKVIKWAKDEIHFEESFNEKL